MPGENKQAIDAVAAAPFGSASIALISWAYVKMLGGNGLNDSSKMALLNANYIAGRLSGHYALRYKNENGRVAHELLIDLAEFSKSAGLKVTDFAKRLQVRWLFIEKALFVLRWTFSGLRFPPSYMLMAYTYLYAY